MIIIMKYNMYQEAHTPIQDRSLLRYSTDTIKYCRTEDMIADYQTKPLVGPAFVRMRKQVMNFQ